MDIRRTGRQAMEVWAKWRQEELSRCRGWPPESTEGRAMAQAAAATRTDGIARWRGSGAPPRVPRETRTQATAKVPRIDMARLGPEVHRLLLDLEATRLWRASVACKLSVLTQAPACERAAALDVSPATYRRDVEDGLLWVGFWLLARNTRKNPGKLGA